MGRKALQVIELDVARLIDERTDTTRVPRLFGPRTLAARFDLSRMTLYRLHKEGKLRGVRVAGVLRFTETDVLNFLRAEGLEVEGD